MRFLFYQNRYMDHLKKLIESAKKDFEECTTLTELDNAKSKYIGKTGP